MITFGVKFYNATTSEWIINEFSQASIALYTGTRLLTTEQSDVEDLLPGEIDDFDIDRGTNIARLLKGMYHTIIDEGGVANTEVRACLTNDTNHNYIAYSGRGSLIFSDSNGKRESWQAFFDVEETSPFFFTNSTSINNIFPLHYDRPVIFGCVITEETRVMLLPRDYILTSSPTVEGDFIEDAFISRCQNNNKEEYTKSANIQIPSNRTTLIPYLIEKTSSATGATYHAYGLMTMWASALSNYHIFVTEQFDSGRTYTYDSVMSPFSIDYSDPETGWEGKLYSIEYGDSNDSFIYSAILQSTNPSAIPSAISLLAILQNIAIMSIRIPIYLTLYAYDNGDSGSDVDPQNPPDPYDPPTPIPPDSEDPYYDPTSDPQNPQYDPTKDPTSPEYDPTEPHTPWRPPSTESVPTVPPSQPPQDVIEVPPLPPAFVTNNAMFTLYNPSGGDLNSLANFLWSPQWSIDTFKKIFANPLDCILGLMVMPLLPASTSTKEMAVGNIATGVTMRYFTHQFYDFDCGTFKIEEYYMSYLDYAPYTKISIYLPYIGDQQLNTDEVMDTSVGVKYRFDLATGDCVAFISVDGSVLYSFSGNCASRLPLAGNNWSGMLPALTMAAFRAGSVAAGVPALGAAAALAVTSMKQDISHTGSMSGSPGLMGVQTPYLIITRPRQALPLSQNSFTGYPSFITESLGSLSGYTEVEACHLEHVPCTGEELEEIERLLKEGVLF